MAALAAKTLVWLLCLMPLAWARGLGRALGGLIFALDGKHRRIALENLTRAFPEKDDAWRMTTARKAMKNLGGNFFEYFHLSDKDREALLDRVTFPDMTAVKKLAGEGKAFLYLTGHCGNWEVLALACSANGYLSAGVGRPLDNPYLDTLLKDMRSRFGCNMISKKKGMRQVLRVLSGGGSVGVLMDQNVDRKEGVFVDFFGTPACTNKGLAILAGRGYPVVPMFIHRSGDRYNVTIAPALSLSFSGNEERDIRENTAVFTRVIEEQIRQFPEEWLWFHRRWKTRPLETSEK